MTTYIIGLLHLIKTGDKTELLRPLTPADLLPHYSMRQIYYRYHGSLTTPACDENVEWTVYQSVVDISETQVCETATYIPVGIKVSVITLSIVNENS